MSYRQPRVPEYRESEGVSRYIRPLILFLKDFSMAAWTANNQRIREIEALRADMPVIPETPGAPEYPVTSVNGKTGDVALTAADVGALADTYAPPVTGVNGQTGEVTLTAADVGALADTYVPPVTGVNGQTGDVQITAADLGALTADTAVTSGTGTRNSTNTTAGTIAYRQFGRTVVAYVDVTMASGVSSTWTSYTIASGLPKAAATVRSASVCSDASDANHFLSISNGGTTIALHARRTAVNGQRLYGTIVYFT